MSVSVLKSVEENAAGRVMKPYQEKNEDIKLDQDQPGDYVHDREHYGNNENGLSSPDQESMNLGYLNNLEDIFFRTPVGHIICGKSGEILMANQAAVRLLTGEGRIPEGTTITAMLDHEYHNTLENMYRELLQGMASGPLVVKKNTVTGETRHLRIEGRPFSRGIKRPGSVNAAFFLSITDISREIQELAALRASEDKYWAMMNFSGDAVLLFDDMGRVTDANLKAQSLFGYTKKNLLGKHMNMLYPVEEFLDNENIFKEITESGAAGIMDMVIIRNDGMRVPVNITGSVIEYGGNIHLQVILRDISEKKKVEQDIMDLLSETNQIFNISTTGLCLISRDLTILRANEAYRTLFGIVEDISGRKCHDILGRECCERTSCLLKHGLGKVDYNEYEISGSKDGVDYHYLVAEVPFHNRKGEVLGILRSNTDITAIRRLEKELITISDRERQRVGQDLHDEIGQIMTGMSFMIEKLEKRMKKGGYPESGMVEEINELNTDAIGKMRRLMKGLNPVHLADNTLAPALRELALETMRVFGAEITYIDEVGIESIGHDEALQVYYIIKESIHNSVKHGKAEAITVGFRKNGEGYTLEIVDNGKISYRKNHDGEGLGLQIMKYRSEMIGAKLNYGPVDGGFRVFIKKGE